MDELTNLLAERNNAASSCDCTLADVVLLDGAIDKWIHDFLGSSTDHLPILKSQMQGEPSGVYAAAFVLLRMEGAGAVDLIVSSLLEDRDPSRLSAVCRALCDSPIDSVPLELLLDVASPEVASAILLALAAHQKEVNRPRQIEEFMTSKSLETRSRAWLIVALSGLEHTGQEHAV